MALSKNVSKIQITKNYTFSKRKDIRILSIKKLQYQADMGFMMKLRPEKSSGMLIITKFKNCYQPPLLSKTSTLPVLYQWSDMVSDFHGRVNIINIENKALIKVAVPR